MNSSDLLLEQTYSAMLQENAKKAAGTDYGCLMVNFEESDAKEIVRWVEENIPTQFLAEFGLEDEPHITCQYGFHGDVSIEEITDFVDSLDMPIHAELNDISRFQNEEYDVIKVDVNSDDLQKLSDRIREHFNGRLEVTFPNYHPHVTLAYVKKGELPHLDGDTMFYGKNYVFDKFIYSGPNGEDKYDIKK